MTLDVLVEPPGSASVALDQRDTPGELDVDPFVQGHVAVEEEGGNAPGDGWGVHLQARQQVVYGGNGPELTTDGCTQCTVMTVSVWEMYVFTLPKNLDK